MLLLNFPESCFCVIAFVLVVTQNFGRNNVRSEFRAHPATGDLFPSSGHGTKGLDQIPGERHDLPLFPVRDAVCLGQVLRNQCVLDSFVEGGSKLGFLGFDEVEESGDVFRGLGGFWCDTRELLQHHERGATDVVLPKVLNTRLRLFDGVHHEMIERSRRCRDSNVVLLWNGSEIPEATLDGMLGLRISGTNGTYVESVNATGALQLGEAF